MLAAAAVLALAGSAVASPLEARSYTSIRASIADISRRVEALTASLNGTGQLDYGTAIRVAGASSDLNNAIKNGTREVNNTRSVTSAQGTQIIRDVNALQPRVTRALNAFINRKQNFQNLGLIGIARSQLAELNTSTTIFANLLIAKAPTAALKANGTAIKRKIDADFARAVRAYAS